MLNEPHLIFSNELIRRSMVGFCSLHPLLFVVLPLRIIIIPRGSEDGGVLWFEPSLVSSSEFVLNIVGMDGLRVRDIKVPDRVELISEAAKFLGIGRFPSRRQPGLRMCLTSGL